MMIPKRTIDEVVQRYRLEPTIREVFVEGPFDRDIYAWVLKKLKLESVKIYLISTINVDEEVLRKYGLTSGERQRLVAFAREISERDVKEGTLACVIDSDLDYFMSVVDDCPILEKTEGTCAEMLVWKRDVLQRFCGIVLGCEDPATIANKVMAEVEPMVCDVFFLRVAIAKLALNWELIDLENAFDRKKPITFSDYCERVANKNCGRKVLDNVANEIDVIRKSDAASLDRTCRMHGHDLMGAVRKALQNFGFEHGCLKNSFDLARTLVASLEWEHVSEDRIAVAFNKLR